MRNPFIIFSFLLAQLQAQAVLLALREVRAMVVLPGA